MFLFVVFIFCLCQFLFVSIFFSKITSMLLKLLSPFSALFILISLPIDTKRKELNSGVCLQFTSLPEDYPVFLVQLTQSNLFQIYILLQRSRFIQRSRKHSINKSISSLSPCLRTMRGVLVNSLDLLKGRAVRQASLGLGQNGFFSLT